MLRTIAAFLAFSVMLTGSVQALDFWMTWNPFTGNFDYYAQYTSSDNISVNCLNLSGDQQCAWPGAFNDTQKAGGGIYLYNDSTAIYVNETVLNNTFVDIAGDTMVGDLIINANLTVDTNTLFVDSALNRIGIGTATPQQKLEVIGNINATGNITALNVTAEEFLGKLSCTNLYNGSDTDFCDDSAYNGSYQIGIGSDCSADNYVYGVEDDGTLLCRLDQQGAGGTGDPHWIDGGDYLYPNSSYANNTKIFGYIQADNWTNVSVTESQISDLQSYLTAESDPLWSGNATAALNQTATDVACSDCVGDDDVVDTLTCSNYITTASEGDLNVNGSDYWQGYNATNTSQFENEGGLLHLISSWLTAFIDAWFGGKTTDDLPEGSTNKYDNGSWNQTGASELFMNKTITTDDIPQGSVNEYENKTWNQTLGDSLYISSGNASVPQWANQTATGVECTSSCVSDAEVDDTITCSNYIATASEGDLNVNDSVNWDGHATGGACSDVCTDADTQLSEEQVEDYAGGMWTGNTESGVDVVYQDGDGTIDVTFDCSDVAGDGLNCDGEDLVFECSDVQGSGINCYDSNIELGSLTKNWDPGNYNITANGFKLGDNEKVYMGDSDDARSYFNGTCWRVEVGTTIFAVCP